MATLQETIKTIPNPEMRRFFEDAAMYIEHQKADQVDPCFAIQPGTTEWRQWEHYLLRRIGLLPWAMREVKAGRGTSATMPSRFPHWFDEHATQTEHWDRSEAHVGPQERARVAGAMDSLADELSMGKPDAERRRAERNFRGRETREKPKPPSVSLDEIRSRYADLTAADFEASPDLVEHLGRQRRDVA